jgi:AraC-like DNA-binding protein
MYVENLRLQHSFAFCRIWGSHEKHDLHIHDCLEIGVLLKHELEYKFGDQSYRGVPGDVFLCRPFEPHWSYAEPGKPFECILILFTPSAVSSIPDGNRLLLPFYTQEGIPPLIPANIPIADEIRIAAVKAMEAKETGEKAWLTQQYMHFINILLKVHEFSEGFLHPEYDYFAPQTGIMDTVRYMLEHYREPLESHFLIERLGIGKTSFFKDFRLLTGVSPNEFLNRLRVQAAMDLLRSTNLSIIEISETSGFQSLSAFNKQFKRYTDLSPREYRKRMQTLT